MPFEDFESHPNWEGASPRERIRQLDGYMSERVSGTPDGTAYEVWNAAREQFKQGATPAQIDQFVDNALQPQGTVGEVHAASERAAGNLMGATGGAASWLGMESLGQTLTESGRRLRQNNQISDETAAAIGQFDFGDLGNPQFWTSKGAEQIFTNLPLMAIMWGPAALARGAMLAKGSGQLAAGIGGAAAGTLAGTPMEALVEAGDAYNQTIEQGGTREQAGKAASVVFDRNVKALGASNAAEIGISLAASRFIPKSLRSGFTSWLQMGGRAGVALGGIAASGGIEGAQELAQQYYQDAGMQWALGAKENEPTLIPPSEDIAERIQTPEGKEAFAMGAIMGMGMSSAPSLVEGSKAIADQLANGDITTTEALQRIIELKRKLETLDDQQLEQRAYDEQVPIPEGASRRQIINAVARKQNRVIEQGMAAAAALPATEVSTNAQAAIEELRKAHPQLADAQIEVLQDTAEMARIRRDVEPITNAEIVFVRGTGNAINGYITENQQVILVDAGAQNTYEQVIGHELTHRLEQEHPDLFAEITEAATNDKNFAGWLEVLNSARAKADLRPLTADEAKGEHAADFVGQFLLDPKFLTRVAMRKPGVIAGVEGPIRKLMNKLTARLPQSSPGAKKLQATQSKLEGIFDRWAGRVNPARARVKGKKTQGDPVARSQPKQSKEDAQQALDDYRAGEPQGLFSTFRDLRPDERTLMDPLAERMPVKTIRQMQRLQALHGIEENAPIQVRQRLVNRKLASRIHHSTRKSLTRLADIYTEWRELHEHSTGYVPLPYRFSLRRKPAPKKTGIGYKLMRVKKSRPGELFPLFMGAKDPAPVGVWLDAEIAPGPMAVRPGWHFGDLPRATHIGARDKGLKKGPPQYRDWDTVWVEAEYANDVDWQPEANRRASHNQDGTIIARTAEITDQIPTDGAYRYKTNPNMEGEWIISGAAKINRVLSDAEVAEITGKAGTSDLPRPPWPDDGKLASAKKALPGGAFSLPHRDYLQHGSQVSEGHWLSDAELARMAGRGDYSATPLHERPLPRVEKRTGRWIAYLPDGTEVMRFRKADARAAIASAAGVPVARVMPSGEIKGGQFSLRKDEHTMSVERKKREKNLGRVNATEKKMMRVAINKQGEKLTLTASQRESVEREVREIKGKHPQSEGWAPLEFLGVTWAIKKKKDEKSGKSIETIVFKYQFAKIPYTFDRRDVVPKRGSWGLTKPKKDKPAKLVFKNVTNHSINQGDYSKKQPLKRQKKSKRELLFRKMRDRRVAKMGKKLADEVITVVQSARGGDQNAEVMVRQLGWYRNMAVRLREEFGGFADLFTDLLGALSPNTPVMTNYRFAMDVLEQFTSGQFTPQMKAFIAHVQAGGKISTFPDKSLIRQVNEKKFGMNSKNAMRALAGMFRAIEQGDAPKAKNFALNLIGESIRATIDVWAARTLQRLAGGERIPSMAEQGVSGEMVVESATARAGLGWDRLVPDTLVSDSAFGFGQMVFQDAVDRLADAGLTELDGMTPADLQALVWFMEKARWTENDWTSGSGEGGSFEQEANIDAIVRFVMGISQERPDDRPSTERQEREAAVLQAKLQGLQGVMAARVADTMGMFFNEVERSLDTELIAETRTTTDVKGIVRVLAEHGKLYDQDAVLVTRFLRENEYNIAAQGLGWTKERQRSPGMEVWFNQRMDKSFMDRLDGMVRGAGFAGMTVIQDVLRTGAPTADWQTGIGVRILHIPEWSDTSNYQAEDALVRLARDFSEVSDVRLAKILYHDTLIMTRDGESSYDTFSEKLTETDRQLREGGQLVHGESASPATENVDRDEGPGDVGPLHRARQERRGKDAVVPPSDYWKGWAHALGSGQFSLRRDDAPYLNAVSENNLDRAEQIVYQAAERAWGSEVQSGAPPNQAIQRTIDALREQIERRRWAAITGKDPEMVAIDKEKIQQAELQLDILLDRAGVPVTGKPGTYEVFHGTPYAFSATEFDPRRGGDNTGSVDARLAHFFSGSRDTADAYRGFSLTPDNDVTITYQLALRTENPLVVEMKGRPYTQAKFRASIEQAEADGHDAVIFLNARDGGPIDNVFALLHGHENQIKSLAPIERYDRWDDAVFAGEAQAGDVIPPSKRFDPKRVDFRFSLRRPHLDRAIESIRQKAVPTAPPLVNRAIPVSDPEARDAVRILDDEREQAGEPETRSWDEVEAEADRILQENGVDAELARLKREPAISDTDMRIFAKILERGAMPALRSQDPAALREWSELVDKYRDDRADVARALAIGRDRFETPEQRLAHFLNKAILRPKPELEAAIDRAKEEGNTEQAGALWKQHEADLAKLFELLRAAGIDLATIDLSNPAEVQKVMRVKKNAQGGWGDVLHEYWMNAILSGPKTHTANLLGTAYAAYDLMIVDAVEAGLARGKKKGSADFAEWSHAMKAMEGVWGKATKNAIEAWRTEVPVLEPMVTGMDPKKAISKLEKGYQPGAIGGKKGRAIRVPTRFLLAADEFLKTIYFHMALGKAAYRNARDAGLTGDALQAEVDRAVSDLGSEASRQALLRAKKLAFQDRKGLQATPVLGSLVESIASTKQKGGVLGTLAKYLIPFETTPGNLLRYGVTQLTPLGWMTTVAKARNTQLVRDGKRDNKWTYSDPGEMAHDIAAHVLSTVAMFAILELVAGDDDGEPRITGGGAPFQKRGEKDHERRNRPPMSIRIGDTWYSYQRIDPLATGLAMMVDLADAVKRSKSGMEREENLKRLYSAIVTEQLKNKTYLKSIGDIMKAVESPDSFGKSMGINFASSWSPAILRHAVSAGDDTVRTYRPEPDSGLAGIAQTIGQRAFPAETFAPRPKRDPWGREVRKTGDGVMSEVGRFLSPTLTVDATTPTQLDRLIQNWADQNPNDAYYVSIPQQRFTFEGEEYAWTNEEYDAFLVARGERIVSMWERATKHRRIDYAKPKEGAIKLLKVLVGRADTIERTKARRAAVQRANSAP